MQEQRQRFRFRLPWPTGPAAAPPRAQPPQTQAAAAQPATTQTTQAPSQRPPFRPAGIAPIQPPPQAPPPPRPATRSASPAPSPSRRPNATQAASAAPQPRPASTPSPAPPKPSQAAPKPQSLSGLASTSTGATSSQPPPRQDISRPSPPPKAQSISQETNQPQSQDPKPRSESSPETVVASGNQPLKETIFPSNEVSPQPEEPAPTKPTTSQKMDDGNISIDHSRLLSESEAKVVQEPVKEEKTADKSYYEQSIQKRITQLLTAASGSGIQTKELRTVSFQAEQKQETLSSTNMVPSNSSDTKQVTAASSRFPKVTQTQHTEPHQDPVMSNGERPPLHKEVRNDISKFVHKLAPGHIKEPINEKPVSIVTLAGENRGASMQLGLDSAKKGGSLHIHRGYKMQPDESPETSTDGEESLKGRSKDHMAKEDQAMKAYVNNNVQSINNSIIFDCSVTERNPGVQLVLSQSQAQPNKSNTAAELPQASKVEFRVTPAEKRTYQPTIRRRCLRGLFMEPSDSESDNPEKPRRHGCRYICGEKSKDKDIGIF